MRRSLVFGLLIITIVLAVVAIYFLAVSKPLGSDDPAVTIALADPDVRTAIDNDGGQYTVDSVVPQEENGNSGFAGINESLIAVHISMPNSITGRDKYVAFVDLNQGKVVSGEWYSYRGTPASLDINLPPGASYYHVLNGAIETGLSLYSGEYGREVFWYTLAKLSPANATVYPVLLDNTNLSRMIRGESYAPATAYDTYLNCSSPLDGLTPVGAVWAINSSVSLRQAYGSGTGSTPDANINYYLVMKNKCNVTVEMEIMM